MIDMGLQAMQEYTQWLRRNFSSALSIDMEWQTMKFYRQQAATDQRILDGVPNRPQLTAHEKQKVDTIRHTWKQAMAQPLQYGKDLERDLLDKMAQHQATFYAGGGIAASDSVPAMLTPGEYVVNRDAVARWGAGFFESLNRLQLPAQNLASRVQGFAHGGLVHSTPSPSPSPLAAVTGATLQQTTPVRTVRVELRAGAQMVAASMAETDESRLLDLLHQARARA